MAELTHLLIKGVHLLMNIKVGSEDHILQDSTDVKICVCVCVCVCLHVHTHIIDRWPFAKRQTRIIWVLDYQATLFSSLYVLILLGSLQWVWYHLKTQKCKKTNSHFVFNPILFNLFLLARNIFYTHSTQAWNWLSQETCKSMELFSPGT